MAIREDEILAMNYAAQKKGTVIFGSIFMGVGGIGITVPVLAGNWATGAWDDMIAIAFLSIFFFAGLAVIRTGLKRIRLFEHNTYARYLADNPGCVRGNVVACAACGCTRIHARALLNRTFHREHFCTQCGQTLYYSPEQM